MRPPASILSGLASPTDFDAVSAMGALVMVTSRVQIDSSVLSVYSRTFAMIATSVAGVDALSGGRALLGLGASGPQVVEGWHGVPSEGPIGRTRCFLAGAAGPDLGRTVRPWVPVAQWRSVAADDRGQWRRSTAFSWRNTSNSTHAARRPRITTTSPGSHRTPHVDDRQQHQAIISTPRPGFGNSPGHHRN